MFYDEAKAIESCIEDPSLIFELIKEGHFELVDKLLTKKLVDINTCDESGNNVLMRLLKRGQYELVLKHMKNKKLNINHQNYDGDTFAHILVSINYVNVLEIIKALVKNKEFLPNIKNNKGYGTKDHLEALRKFGPVKGLHRFSYRPVYEANNVNLFDYDEKGEK